MGTSLDIKIKRANKVYHAGVSRVGWPTGSVVCRAPRTSGCPWAGQSAPPGASPPGASPPGVPRALPEPYEGPRAESPPRPRACGPRGRRLSCRVRSLAL